MLSQWHFYKKGLSNPEETVGENSVTEPYYTDPFPLQRQPAKNPYQLNGPLVYTTVSSPRGWQLFYGAFSKFNEESKIV